MEKIYTGLLNEITGLIKDVGFGPSDYMILEKVDDIKFENYNPENFEAWEKGIIFSENKEFKWREIDGIFHVVFSGNAVAINTLEELMQVKTDEENFPIILWGQQSPEMDDFGQNEYIELPISKILSYPIQSDYRVKVILKIQKSKDGEIIGYRFSKIVEETKK